MRRSQSADLSHISREKYLSNWSRKNTPNDNGNRYHLHIKRSFTPVRRIYANEVVKNSLQSCFVESFRSSIDITNSLLLTNLNYYSENEPVQKYDVFQLRTWSYPIYKYVYGKNIQYTRPYNYTRLYANKSNYTPSPMTPEVTTMTSRRSYSGYNYVSSECNFNIAAKPWSLSHYLHLKSSHVLTAPQFLFGQSNLRHHNNYHLPSYSLRFSTYWRPYY